MKKTVKIDMRLDEETKLKLIKLAEKSQIKLSTYCVRVLKNHVERS